MECNGHMYAPVCIIPYRVCFKWASVHTAEVNGSMRSCTAVACPNTDMPATAAAPHITVNKKNMNDHKTNGNISLTKSVMHNDSHKESKNTRNTEDLYNMKTKLQSSHRFCYPGSERGLRRVCPPLCYASSGAQVMAKRSKAEQSGRIPGSSLTIICCAGISRVGCRKLAYS